MNNNPVTTTTNANSSYGFDLTLKFSPDQMVNLTTLAQRVDQKPIDAMHLS